MEDFATDWMQAHKWEPFFLFFNHCAREVLLMASRLPDVDQQYSELISSEGLRWSAHMKNTYHWVYGTLDIELEFQLEESPLHRAARIASMNDDPSVYESLLRVGVDPKLVNRKGVVAKDMVCRRGENTCAVRENLKALEAKYGHTDDGVITHADMMAGAMGEGREGMLGDYPQDEKKGEKSKRTNKNKNKKGKEKEEEKL